MLPKLNSLAERFNWLLETKNISQRQLAKRLDTPNPAFLSKISRGESKKTRMIVDIALELGVTAEWLEYGIEDARSPTASMEDIANGNAVFLSNFIKKASKAKLSAEDIQSRTHLTEGVISNTLAGKHTLTLHEALLYSELFQTSIYEMIKPDDQTNTSIPLVGGQDILDKVIAVKTKLQADFLENKQSMIGIKNDGSFSGHYIDKGNVVIIDPDFKSHNIQNGDPCVFIHQGQIDIGVISATNVRSLSFFTNVYNLSDIEVLGKVAYLEATPATSDASDMLEDEKERFISSIRKIIPDGIVAPFLAY